MINDKINISMINHHIDLTAGVRYGQNLDSDREIWKSFLDKFRVNATNNRYPLKICFILLKVDKGLLKKKRFRGYSVNFYVYPMTQMVHQTTTCNTSQIKKLFIESITLTF